MKKNCFTAEIYKTYYCLPVLRVTRIFIGSVYNRVFDVWYFLHCVFFACFKIVPYVLSSTVLFCTTQHILFANCQLVKYIILMYVMALFFPTCAYYTANLCHTWSIRYDPMTMWNNCRSTYKTQMFEEYSSKHIHYLYIVRFTGSNFRENLPLCIFNFLFTSCKQWNLTEIYIILMYTVYIEYSILFFYKCVMHIFFIQHQSI